MPALVALILLLLSSGACDPSSSSGAGGESGRPDRSPPATPDTVTREDVAPLLRVDLRRAEGVYTIVDVQDVEVAGGADRPAALLGQVMLLAYADDKLVSAELVAFPDTALLHRGESTDSVPVAGGFASVFVPIMPRPTRLELVDVEGHVLDQREDLAGTRKDRTAEQVGAVKIMTPQDQVWADLHLQIAQLGLVDDEVTQIKLAEPRARDLEMVVKGLARAPARVRLAVNYVAFAPLPDDLRAFTLGSAVVFNVSAWADQMNDDSASRGQLVVVHEATHAFEHLVSGAQNPSNDAGPYSIAQFSEAARAVGLERAQTLSLTSSLTETWKKLHQAGVELGFGARYGTKYGSTERDYAGVIDGGFASRMGAASASEDLVEWAAQLIVYEDYGGFENVCERLSKTPPGTPLQSFPQRDSLLLAKLEFAHTIGIIGDAQYKSCGGGVTEILTQPGIHLRLDTGSIHHLTESVKGGIRINEEGNRVLNVLANGNGGDVKGLIEVAAPEPGSGQGVHPLDEHTSLLSGLALGDNTIILTRDNEERLYLSMNGLVLVTEVTEEAVKGLIFGVGLRRELFVTDHITLGSFNLPKPRL